MTNASIAKKQEQMTLRVLIVDDHTLVSETLIAALKVQDGMEGLAVRSIDDACDEISRNGHYDAVLLDYDVPGMDNLNGLQRLLETNGGKVALFSGVAGWAIVERAIDAGALGFIPKTSSIKTVGHAISFIADGELYLPSDLMLRRSRDDQSELGLKPRENRVLALLCEGMPNKEIGRIVGIEETTVKMDVKSICRKLGVQNRTQAVITALKKGLH